MFPRKLNLIPVFLVTLIGVILLYTLADFLAKPLFDAISNHQTHAKDGILDDILNATVKPDGGRSIFFLITKSSGNGEISLTPR